tara:strand:- start:318 stop:998 length:681 start_codon:yes stop_codon:yes gene_type:complete
VSWLSKEGNSYKDYLYHAIMPEEKLQVMVGVVVPKGKEFALEAFKEATKDFLGETFTPKGSGLSASEQRKKIVEEAKKRKVAGILFFECDVIPPDNVLGLINVKADIVGGAYLGWQDMGKPKVAPCSYAHDDKGIAFIPVDVFMGDQVIPVSATQFGCAFVRKEVYDKIAWPDDVNDDIALCLEARKQGLNVVVHTGVKCVRKTPQKDLNWPTARVGYEFSEETDQ